MEVYITVDTECTEERLIRGRVRPPLGYDLMMRGRLNGQLEGMGTDLVVRELSRHDFRATFFVEALCAEYFGIEGLSEVCRDLRDSGHDVQLHLHPNFRRPEWRRFGTVPLPDNIGEYDLQSQIELLERGLELLQQAGVPRSSVVAFRAGNYGASNATWNALQRVGLPIDSSLNLCYIDKGCGIVPDRPRIDLYQPIPGVWELPISCFREGSGYRHLEITAVLSEEITNTLEQLRAAGAESATIVTHPAEFFVIDDHIRRIGRPNRINISRLRRLLTFLDESRDRFVVTTVGSLAERLSTSIVRAEVAPTEVPSGSKRLRAARLPIQLAKRWLTRAPLSA